MEGRGKATSMRHLAPAPEGAMRGLLCRRQRDGTCENETIRAGLRPDGVYVYAKRSQGRTIQPFLASKRRCGEASSMMSGKPIQRTQRKQHYLTRLIAPNLQTWPHCLQPAH